MRLRPKEDLKKGKEEKENPRKDLKKTKP